MNFELKRSLTTVQVRRVPRCYPGGPAGRPALRAENGGDGVRRKKPFQNPEFSVRTLDSEGVWGYLLPSGVGFWGGVGNCVQMAKPGTPRFV